MHPLSLVALGLAALLAQGPVPEVPAGVVAARVAELFEVQVAPDAPPLLLPRDERLAFGVRAGFSVLDARVGTVRMECKVQSARGSLVLKAPQGAPVGEQASLRIVAEGEHTLYSLDAEIKTDIHPQRWPWIVYYFEQREPRNSRRTIRIGWRDDKPHLYYQRDTDTGAPKGTRVWKDPKERDLPVPAVDLLTAVYYARVLIREERKSFSFPMADKFDLWQLNLRRGASARLETKAGEFDAVQILIEPAPYPGEVAEEKIAERAKKFEGLFGMHGSIELWVQKDTGVPLRIEGEIPIGLGLDIGVSVELETYSGTPPEFRPVI
jgi:hypothetical protein